MITRITKTYVRHYRDNGQTVAFAEWTDRKGEYGRTEGAPDSAHMRALIARGAREGAPHHRETW